RRCSRCAARQKSWIDSSTGPKNTPPAGSASIGASRRWNCGNRTTSGMPSCWTGWSSSSGKGKRCSAGKRRETVPGFLGLDIGGANLKAAHSGGNVRIQPFPLWKHPGELTEVLRELVDSMPAADVLAVTMTGELCDCFDSKRQGVLAIL